MAHPLPRSKLLSTATLGLLLTAGCSPSQFAVNKLGDALAAPGTTFSADDDPDFVAQAIPFSLKLIESLLASTPKHEGLLFAAASGFTQYSVAFVEQEADVVEATDFARATMLRGRARRLDLRARDYGLRGLEARHEHFAERLRADPRAAVKVATKEDVPMLYWTAAAWGSAMSLSKDNPEIVADQLIAEALIDRALELDEAWDFGSIHSFLITYEMSRQGAQGDPAARAKAHFDRAVALSEGRQAGPYLSYVEAVSIPKQNKAEFEELLKKALAIDADAKPERRLANLVMQRRARWLLSREGDLFLDKLPPETPRAMRDLYSL